MVKTSTLIRLQAKLTALRTESFGLEPSAKVSQTKIVTMKSRVEIFDTTCRRWNKAVSRKLLIFFFPVRLSDLRCDNIMDKYYLLKIELEG